MKKEILAAAPRRADGRDKSILDTPKINLLLNERDGTDLLLQVYTNFSLFLDYSTETYAKYTVFNIRYLVYTSTRNKGLAFANFASAPEAD